MKHLVNSVFEADKLAVRNNFPDNLIMAAYHLQDIDMPVITADMRAGMNYLINLCDDRIKDIVLTRYNKKCSFKEIGRRHGISSSYTGNLAHTFLSELCDDKNTAYYMEGLSVAKAREAQKQAQIEYEDAVNPRIEDLVGMTQRLRNLLRRNGIHRASDLQNISLSKFATLKNAGAGTVQTLVYVCNMNGIAFKA